MPTLRAARQDQTLSVYGPWADLSPLALAIMERVANPLYGGDEQPQALLAVRVPSSQVDALNHLVDRAKAHNRSITRRWSATLFPEEWLQPVSLDDLALPLGTEWTRYQPLRVVPHAQTSTFRLHLRQTSLVYELLSAITMVHGLYPTANGELLYFAGWPGLTEALRRQGLHPVRVVGLPAVVHQKGLLA